MRIRQHRGGLAESLETAVYMPPTMESIATFCGAKMPADSVELQHYGNDARLGGGPQYLVLVNGFPAAWVDQVTPVDYAQPLPVHSRTGDG